ncbi:RecQ family ATP-dependent DNA helicase [Terrimonas sp. NA20]|uniref:DNA 3'-5' helicase n=1 Tax=Terrimonas ginsenosidimutans TaxID=2908004 RepID=A0ABS9KKE6_9BACT|nr:RecQ family ATP-dependent DNA helicase [Terrimonas ginsenosidimutans]MCG2612788.1 RecQ family ATP-dependent DNA helicase [Terrimonas ginsenosidimutans]
MNSIAFFDLEVNPSHDKIVDAGATASDGKNFRENNAGKLLTFLQQYAFWCGHNIVEHDLKYLTAATGQQITDSHQIIDTLLLSPLLFPCNPYHHLIKDDKLELEERNNPLHDSIKAKELFYDEIDAFKKLPDTLQHIFHHLLKDSKGFDGFFRFINFNPSISTDQLPALIHTFLKERICANADLSTLIHHDPVTLSYAIALINCEDQHPVTLGWVTHQFKEIEQVLVQLKHTSCADECDYCKNALNPKTALLRYFRYHQFRQYGQQPLQENSVRAAIAGESLLALFPTGGGKSLTFQLPALMAGQNIRGLTVVISPLQSLMKDQVDNLAKKEIVQAVTINGSLDFTERIESGKRVADGVASMLYISPESLRSASIERLLSKRKIERFVIDEAHCFSSWGHDFRVDYLYVGDFIRRLQESKNLSYPIPVSCFTATARQKVVDDIREYFKTKLSLQLNVFSANVGRTNLYYHVHPINNEDEKYPKLRELLEQTDRPTIVYVSRTKKADVLAEKLSEDHFSALPYHGKMGKEVRIKNQNAFVSGEVRIIVATSAFGMGVDKSDVATVIHYDIADSLENYIQEAGRAGRDETMTANCHILFNEEDLDHHFTLLNQTKLDIKEINQVWKAIKGITKTRTRISYSALEIARKAGWEDQGSDIETKVTTSIAALEEAGYLKRTQNSARVFATSILSQHANEAIATIKASATISDKESAIRIIRKLFSSKSKRLATEEPAESRADHLSDVLGIEVIEVLRIIEQLKQEKILSETQDLTAFVRKTDTSSKTLAVVKKFSKLESQILDKLADGKQVCNLKELNDQLAELDCSPASIRTILNFWASRKWITRHNLDQSKYHVMLEFKKERAEIRKKIEERHALSGAIAEYLVNRSKEIGAKDDKENVLVDFSMQDLRAVADRDMFIGSPAMDDIEDALFYLSKIEAIIMDGGFLVSYNRLTIERLEMDNKVQYKKADYEKLRQFYEQKVQQIHIVGEYAKKMIASPPDAQRFADEYFNTPHNTFLNKYFAGKRKVEITRSMTPGRYEKLLKDLSHSQLDIINDQESQYIVVTAGPGSGKTRTLVHKLASLLLMEDTKQEHLLMLTFSRAAATEFKSRLLKLIGPSARHVEMKTFHSYCFDLLGKIGNLTQVDTVIPLAVEKINNGEIEQSQITKTVLVIDEAQDMSKNEYGLLEALIQQNEDMRVILVGDDDQHIYGFRGSSYKFMQQFAIEKQATKYELLDNYRSRSSITQLINRWAEKIPDRLKSKPIVSVKKEGGHIKVVQHAGSEMIVPLVTAIEKQRPVGTTCVLTKTNQEALNVAGLLRKKGLKAKLIQNTDKFNLNQLYELHKFNTMIQLLDDSSPIVSDEDWEAAILQLKESLAGSEQLPLALSMIYKFAEITPGKKYKSDWHEFVRESKIEDFIQGDRQTILVSTIHKAKGKEFENVYLLLDGCDITDADTLRLLYVGFSRAENELIIHYNGTYLENLGIQGAVIEKDPVIYAAPDLLSVQMSMKDVKLGDFSAVQYNLAGCKSGDLLRPTANGLAKEAGIELIVYSRKMRAFLDEEQMKGYVVNRGKISFLVYWKNKENEKEILIALAEVEMKRG